MAYSGTEYEDKRYNIGPAPDFDRSEWLNDKQNLGLDFPNVIIFISKTLISYLFPDQIFWNNYLTVGNSFYDYNIFLREILR